MSEIYMKEILKRFSSKTKVIFDLKKDGDSILNFISKVYGKSRLISFQHFDDNDLTQLVYLNGKLELMMDSLSFERNDVFT